VRHVRMLVLCLVALFAMGAMTAGTAMAKKSEWLKYENCPIHSSEPYPGYHQVTGCIWGASNSNSYFHAGNVTVDFKKPIILIAGVTRAEREPCTEEDDAIYWECGTEAGLKTYGGTHSNEKMVNPEFSSAGILSKVAQPGPSLTESVDTELLSPTELTRYEKLVAAGKTKTTVTVELAGPADSFFLDENSLVSAFGTAIGLPVQIKLSNPFLGSTCYVGSNSDPIQINYTTGTTSPPPPNEPWTGKPGRITTSGPGGEILHIIEGELVDNSFAVPGVSGCGINNGADAAVDAATGLPSAAGHNSTLLEGELTQTSRASVEEAREEGF
jgi:hypothetical protein